jgi:GH24 family phage-related lysozyme (muramidase)/uncharacterized membrane protein YeaQ/YmgE (transglycosylase-associated protein family)
MSRNLSISETGLRLIKAFEGYRPVDRELVTGARVVGYGHRVYEPTPRAMSRDEAENLLKIDLQAYEEMINEEVHAPLTQSQFDALCSLAFNIGPKAFRESDTLRALNNGRILDAANGFDVWRKATIDGKTYVVDALMRRRTAEKSLFLRTERSVPATTALLEPKPDDIAALVPTDDGLPVFTANDRAGVVAKAPYEITPNPLRRREDQEAGILTLSEVVDVDDLETEAGLEGDGTPEIDASALDPSDLDPSELNTEAQIETVDVETTLETEDEAVVDAPLSIVKDAADALGDRLDALIDDEAEAPKQGDWPQSLIQAANAEEDLPDVKKDETPSNLLAFPGASRVATETGSEDVPSSVTDASSESAEMVLDESDVEITRNDPTTFDTDSGMDKASNETLSTDGSDAGWRAESHTEDQGEAGAGLWIPILLGFALLGASLMGLWLGAEDLLGEWGPIMALSGAIIGALMVVFSLYLITAGRLRSA